MIVRMGSYPAGDGQQETIWMVKAALNHLEESQGCLFCAKRGAEDADKQLLQQAADKVDSLIVELLRMVERLDAEAQKNSPAAEPSCGVVEGKHNNH